MTKNRGGRPPLPPPPTTATETRALIAAEIVKTTPNFTKLRHLQKLLKSQQQAEEHSATQAAAERANQLLTESNDLKRSEYQRRYELGQQRADAEVAADSRLVERVDTLTTENSALHSTVATLQSELDQMKDELLRTKSERGAFEQANETLTDTIKTLQPQADTLAKIKSDVERELSSTFTADKRVVSLRAEFKLLEAQEATIPILERMKEILRQIATLRQAYAVVI